MSLNNKNKYLFSTFGLSLVLSSILYANVSGIVFQDLPVSGTTLNTYGLKDTNEQGLAGITVTAYPDGISTITNTDGTWSLATSTDVRVEFSNIPSYLKESLFSSTKNTSVQFAEDGAVVNFALHDVNDYANSSEPKYTTNIISGGSNVNSTIPSLVTNNYTDTGLNAEYKTYEGDQGTGQVPTKDATAGQIGAVWGKGFQTSKQRMFISSVLWRHIGFANGSPSKIFVADYGTSPATILGNIDLQGKSGIDLGSVDRSSGNDYTLDDDPATPSIDLDAYAKIGKVSYGDLDFDNNTETIWTVNLNQKALISVDASGDYASLASATVNQYLIEDLNGVPTCTGGSLRPWGLGIHNGRGYLGSICDASTSQSASDLKAYVSTFDLANPSAGLTTVFSMDMNYDRSEDDGYAENPNFFPWTDSVQDTTTNWDGYNQPILSDIDFDEKGNLYLGFMDRWGMQIGKDNFTAEAGSSSTTEDAFGQGEILKVCNSNGVYELEGTGSCPTGTSPDGDFFDDKGGDNNANPSGGAMAILKGSNQMILAINDPHPAGDTGSTYWTTNGVQTFNTTTGANENWYAHINSGSIEYTGKASGMGDIELLTASAPLEIGDRVWNDNNGNGVQDVAESGISDLSIELVCGGVVASTATTDASGNYIFSNNPNGTSTASHKYNVSALVAGSSDCLVRIPNVQGDAKQASLGSNVLTQANIGEGANSNINDSDGMLNGDNAEANVTAIEIPVNGANNHSFDFGFSLPQKAKLGDLVWEDSNKNGIQDDGENGVAGITVTLKKNCTDANGTTTTDGTGHYLFENIEDGDYCVRFDNLPEGYVVTTQNAGTDDTKDSDVDGSAVDLKSEICTLGAGDVNLTHDLGIYNGKVSIGDKVWNDSDRDGIQDANEEGIEGITAVLYQSDCNTEINTTSTNATGLYLFDNLEAGEYCIGFRDIPTEYTITEQNSTGSTSSNNSDVDPLTAKATSTNLEAGESDLSWDMGIYKLASLGDRVWYDDNKNGKQDNGEGGVVGVNVKLLKDCTTEINSTTTDGNGLYLFSSLEPADYCVVFSNLPADYIVTTQDSGDDDTIDSDADSNTYTTIKTTLIMGQDDRTWDMGIYSNKASIGDRVWYDNNENGIQDADEGGVEGVKVILYQSDCNTSVTSMTTNASGDYRFIGLTPANYCVGFDLSTLPVGYAITDANIGDDNNDSDVDPVTGKTSSTTLDDAEVDMSWDMGIHRTSNSSIGNRVWHDTNANGIQDDGEQGVADINVTLYKDCGAREVKVASSKTNANGEYLFEGLYPDDYCLEFSSLPTGASITRQDQGEDNGTNSDVNPATARTVITTIISGESDQTWDMGIYYLASLGDKVWEDSDRDGIQDDTEEGVEDINVTLYASDCVTDLEQTQTDGNGSYLFVNLMPSEYCIGFSNLPNDYLSTIQNIGNDSNDSDANADLKIQNVVLSSQEHNRSLDMGIHKRVVSPTPTPIPAPVYQPIAYLPASTVQPIEEDNSSLPVEESEEEETLVAEEQGGIFRITDDEVEANTEGSVTTIHVLDNDDNQAVGRTIRLIAIEEGETLWNDGTAVAGANIETTDELYVAGEGTWRVVDGDIVFTAEDGFDGVPTPIYYTVLDENGNSSNIAQVRITSPCVCDTYEVKAQDSIASLSLMGMTLMLFLLSGVALLFIREELATEIK